jgi:hypothetical protein
MLKKVLGKLHLPRWLEITLLVVFLLRIPSFFEPFYYGDEMIYLTLGQGIRQGVPLYSGLHDNKPPLLYLLAALAGNVFWFKVILAFWSLATIILFYKLSERLFLKNPGFQKIATLIFSLATTLPLLEGNIANAENFLIGTTLAGLLIVFSKKLNFKNLLLAGMLFSASALFKIPAVFDFAAILVFWLIVSGFKKTFKNSLPFLLGFALPITLTFVWFASNSAFKDYLVAAFLQNLGYVSSWRPADVAKPFLVKNLPLLIRAAIVVVSAGILFIFRKKLSRQFLFASLWLVFALFAITLSERPYPHYLLQAAAPVSFLLAMLFTKKTIEQSLTVIPLLIFFAVPVYYKYWHYPTVPYYQNFLQFTLGQKSKIQYFSWFGPNTNRNYQLADFLTKSSLPGEKVFVWSPDAPAVYALSRRLPPIKFVANYHIKDFSSRKEIALDLNQKLPKFMVLTSEAEIFSELDSLLKSKYLLIDNLNGAEIWIRKQPL